MSTLLEPLASSGTKLNLLRAKTDRDLVALLQREVDSCRYFLRQGRFREADVLYARTAAILRLVRGLDSEEYVRLQNALTNLRSMIDEGALSCVGAL